MPLKSLAPKSHWEKNWALSKIPSKAFPEISSVRNHAKNEFHHLFSKYIAKGKKASSLIEFGCAQSIWLPYFVRVHGCKVAGLDYSKKGCLRARAMLKREGLFGDIMHRDLFCKKSRDKQKYDFAVSFGLIEHFDKPEKALKAMKVFLKTDGLIFTIIPNMYGINGILQKYYSTRIYLLHRKINKNKLAKIHRKAGLKPIFVDYVLPLSLTIANIGPNPSYFKKCVFNLSKLLTAGFWLLDRIVFCSLSRNINFSPYLVCIAKLHSKKKYKKTFTK